MQFAPVAINGTLGLPVNFTPRDIKDGVATLVHGTGVPIADTRISMQSTRTTAGRRKVSVKVAVPIVQDVIVNGISRPTVVRTGYADLSFGFDETSSTVEREHVMLLLANWFSSPYGAAMITNLDSLY